MKVTLKKASEIARAAIAAGEAIKHKTTVSISTFSTADVKDTIEAARAKITLDLKRAMALIDVGYAIRDQIGRENTANGVDALLNNITKIDKKLSIFPSDRSDRYPYTSAVSSDDIDALKARIENDRTPAADGRVPASELSIAVIDEGMQNTLDAEITDLKRARVVFKDEITALNFTSKIKLADDDVALLKLEKII